jgi:hypothetical protein
LGFALPEAVGKIDYQRLHIQIMEFLHNDIILEIFSKIDPTWAAVASQTCKKWRILLKNRKINLVAAICSWNMVKWLAYNYCPFAKHHSSYAAANGSIGAIKLLKKAGISWDRQTCAHAAGAGKLDVVKWLRANKCPWNTETCFAAACGGHLETIQWLHNNGCPWDYWVSHGAARGGHIQLLQWVVSNYCELNAKTCEGAAEGGHLEVLKWLRARDCPWNTWTWFAASLNYHKETMLWALDNGCPVDKDLLRIGLSTKDPKQLELLFIVLDKYSHL